MSTLKLVSVHDRVRDPLPAAFHEAAAAKYAGTCKTKFRELVKGGVIPYAEHRNGTAKIYLRADIDAYLESLNWRRMPLREVSPVALKGVAE